jgi:hypothetical protein
MGILRDEWLLFDLKKSFFQSPSHDFGVGDVVMAFVVHDLSMTKEKQLRRFVCYS